MESLPSQQAKEETNGWRHKLSVFISFILILQISLFAIIAISEIAARESVLSALTGRIATLKSEFVEQYRTENNISAEPTVTNEFSKDKMLYRERLLGEIEFYETLKRSLIFFIARGSDSLELSLSGIQKMELSYLDRRMKELNFELFRGGKVVNSFSEAYELYLLQSSDQLLAFAVMACAAIGALSQLCAAMV